MMGYVDEWGDIDYQDDIDEDDCSCRDCGEDAFPGGGFTADGAMRCAGCFEAWWEAD